MRFLLLVAFVVRVGSAQPGSADMASQLPALLRAAIGVMPPSERLGDHQLVVLYDLNGFLDSKNISDPAARLDVKRAFAFVLSQRFPIYIDGHNEGYVQATRAFARRSVKRWTAVASSPGSGDG